MRPSEFYLSVDTGPNSKRGLDTRLKWNRVSKELRWPLKKMLIDINTDSLSKVVSEGWSSQIEYDQANLTCAISG